MDKGISLELQKLYEENAIKLVNFFIKNDLQAVKFFDSYEDMRQDLLMRVWMMLPKYDATRGGFATFVNMVCKSEIKMRIRAMNTKKRTGVLVSMEEEVAEGIRIEHLLTDDFDVEEKSVEKSILSIIAKMLNAETYEYFLKGKKQVEIARERNVSQASVSRKIKRNIKQIQSGFVGREL